MERIEVMKWERISLVVPEREDVKIWYKWINNVENQIFINKRGLVQLIESEYDYYDALKIITTKKVFSIMIHESQKIIGRVSLMNISDKNRNAEMGIMICDKSEQNKWYGSEVVKLILQYGFEVLALHKIKLYVLWNNLRAKSVYEKIGFRENGIIKEDLWDGEKYIDRIFMEIFRRDFL